MSVIRETTQPEVSARAAAGAHHSGRPAPRVLHIVPALFDMSGSVGGAERYALELARHMADRVPTRLLSFGDDSRNEDEADCRFASPASHTTFANSE